MKDDTKSTNENTKATENNTEAKKKNTQENKNLKESLKDLLDMKEKSIEQNRREIQYNADLARMQNDQIELQNQLHEAQKALQKSMQASIDIAADQKAAAEEEIKAHEDLIRSIAKAMGKGEEYAQSLIENKIIVDEVTDSTKKYAEASDDLFDGMRAHVGFLFGDNKTGLVGGMFEFAASMKSAEGGLGTFGKSFFKVFNFTTFATAMVNNFIESTVGMVKSFDEAAASFAAATGTGDQFTGTLLEMRQEGNALGVTFENSSKALQSLIENQVGFLGSSKETQKQIATQVALMERIGISTDTSAEMMNVFTINMGKSQQSAIQMTKALASMGSVLGNSQKFLQSFEESLKDLAVYGDGAVEVFSNMAAAARAAGVEVGTLTSLAAKFDTFGEAAEAAGKLNALLGSQISSTQMLLMTEDQRIETLIQQVQVSGESFAQMDRFKQKAIAAAAGITDMNEAQRIFGMNMKEYNKYQKQMERQAKIQDNFNKAIEATVDFQEKFSQFMAEFAIFVQPIANIVGEILGYMTELMASMSEGEKTTLLLVSGLGLAYVAFSGVGGLLPILGGAMAAVTASVTGLSASLTAAVGAMTTFGLASGAASSSLFAFLAPIIIIGGIIALIVWGIGTLVGNFVELGKTGFQAASAMIAISGALSTMYSSSFAGLIAQSPITTLVSDLQKLKDVVDGETSALSNALENLALISTGNSARSMGGQTATITSELRGAVEALTTTKIDISLRIDDNKLYQIMKDAVVDVINNDGEVRREIVNIKLA